MPDAADRRIGPYRLLSELGRGGGGLVYRASLKGRLVALKTVPRGSRHGYAAIRRECLALMGLSHDGLVKVVDEGLKETPPWYAMDLLDGADLLSHARAAWEPAGTSPAIPPPALKKILAACRSLCEPLAYLHGEGIVHRDIKPENVVVAKSGRSVLLDLGLVSRFAGSEGRDSLETLGGTVGTALFMAPEQWRGEEVDARADLFSLGVILYLLLTGKAPFATRREVLDEKVAPPAPSRLVAGLPEALDRLILDLLARDPSRRLGRAHEVEARLAEMTGRKPARHRAGVLLFRSALKGRTREARLLADWLADQWSGLLIIKGESGAGKTRMALELAALAARQRIWILRGEAEGATSPLSAFRGILRFLADYCLAAGKDESCRLFGDRLAPLAPYEPLLPVRTEPAELPPDAARERLLACLTESLGILARERPLLLLIDDFHRADDLSRTLLARLASGPPRVKTAVAWRSDQASSLLAHLAGQEGVFVLDLKRLSMREIGGMAATMLAAASVPDRFRGFLFRSSEGNPMFAAEYLRMALQEGYLARGEKGRWGLTERFLSQRADKMPGSVRQLVSRRLAGLLPESRELLEMVAILDREATMETLALALSVTEREVARPWRELVAGGLLREVDDGRLEFSHEQFRLVAQNAIAGVRKKRLHRRAATALQALREGANQAALAFHLERCGRNAAARSAYLAAGEDARRGFMIEAAESCFRRSLELSRKEDKVVLAALLGLGGEILKLKGELGEAESLLRRATRLAQRLDRLGDRLKALAFLAEILARRGDATEARKLYRKALAIASKHRRRREEASILDGLAILEGQAGAIEEAFRLFERALALHRRSGASGKEGRALASMASLRHNSGEIKAALDLYGRALRLLQKAGDRRGAAVVLVNLGVSAAELGRGEEAADRYAEAAREARAVGDRRLLARILLNFAVYRQGEGRAEAAMRLYGKAAHAAGAVFDRVTEGIAASNMGELCLDLGDEEAAKAHLARARDLLREAGERRFEGHVECQRGELLRRQGKMAEALAALQASRAIARETKDRHGDANATWRLASIARERGDPKARELAEEALGIAREIGETQLHILCLVEHAFCVPGAARWNLHEAMGSVRRMGSNPSGEVAKRLAELKTLLQQGEHDVPAD